MDIIYEIETFGEVYQTHADDIAQDGLATVDYTI